jgi:F-type H+-transporting ATPase subunit gamma
MANIKDLKRRIASLKNMQKVMGAMNMIASIKLRKLFALQGGLRSFEQALEAVARDIGRSLDRASHPALGGYPQLRSAHAVVFTADKGLCGAHNNNVQKAVDALAERLSREGIAIDFTCVGTKGAGLCRRRGYRVAWETAIGERELEMSALLAAAERAYERFLSGELQQIFLVYNRFVTTIHQETETSRVLPLPVEGGQGRGSRASTEPAPEEFLPAAAGRYLAARVQAALANSRLSEQAARMTAMENATNNSEYLINRYVTLQNRARQAAITNEIIEIISGKEALDG